MAWKEIHVGPNTFYINGIPIRESGGNIVLQSGTTIGGVNPGTITIMGSIDNVYGLTGLTGATTIGDGYMVNGYAPQPAHLFVLKSDSVGASQNIDNWADVGEIAGPKGEQGYQGI